MYSIRKDCTMGTGSFPGVKRPGRGVDHQPQSNAEVKERVELHLYSTSGLSWPAVGLTLLLFDCIILTEFHTRRNKSFNKEYRLEMQRILLANLKSPKARFLNSGKFFATPCLQTHR